MREILFRGRNENSTWIYGSLLVDKDTFDKNAFIYYICDIDGYSMEIVNTKTIGQFTGLTDKNGTKIFEGDIIQDSNYPEYVFRIEYHNGTIIASEIHTFDKVYLDNFICFNIFEAFVIGNIHDNPELLEGKA